MLFDNLPHNFFKPCTLVAEGTNEISDRFEFRQAVQIVSGLCEKPNSGGSSLIATGYHDSEHNGVSGIFGGINMGATDTFYEIPRDMLPQYMTPGGHIAVATAGGANGKKAITLYVRAVAHPGGA